MSNDPRNEKIVIFGYGACGAAAALRLIQAGRSVRVAQRRRPADLPVEAEFVATDILDPDAVLKAAQGASQIVLAVGFPYDGKIWRDVWPRTMSNILAAGEVNQARIVFVDNLYMYGPQTEPLHEDMPLTTYGVKPAVRAEITRMWMAASDTGRVKFASLRIPDFYGPGVGAVSHLGDYAFGALVKGKSAMFLVPPDMPHEIAYVPDVGRAVVTLLDAPDDAFGQAWHMPSAPTRTYRELFAIGAAALGVKPRLTAIPFWALSAMAIVMPFMKGLVEMKFQWDRPYHVDHSKFASRFWSDVTPFELGAAATALSFRDSAKPANLAA